MDQQVLKISALECLGKYGVGSQSAHLGLTLMRGMAWTTTEVEGPLAGQWVITRELTSGRALQAPPPAVGKLTAASSPRMAMQAASYARAASCSSSKKPRWFTCSHQSWLMPHCLRC